MGSICQKPKVSSSVNDLDIADILEESNPLDFAERKSINPIILFTTHTAPMTRTSCITNSSIRLDKDILPSNVFEVKGPFIVPRKKNTYTLLSSYIFKTQIKESISLKTPRFIFEQKKSMWDKYELINDLGKGTFGEVKLIRNKETKVKRALKCISKSNCKASANILEEIEILKQLVTFLYYYRIILMY